MIFGKEIDMSGMTAKEMEEHMNSHLKEVEEHLKFESDKIINKLDSEIKELKQIEKKDDLGF